MNALAQSLLGVAKGYLGPAAQTFLSGELHALGVNANTVTPDHVGQLADRIREHAARVMGPQKANELAEAIARCQGVTAYPSSGGHRLASDAAANLLQSGKLRQAEKAYIELIQKHADDVSTYIGLARTQAALEDPEAALTTLRDGAAHFARANDRATAVSLLAEAVGLAPGDLAAHRRLAAALANQGDLPGAVEEYGRFVEVAVASGDPRRALLEIEYGRETLGDVPGLIALVDRVTGATSPSSRTRMDAPQPAARPTTLPHHTAPIAAPHVTPAPPVAPPARPVPQAAASAPADAQPSRPANPRPSATPPKATASPFAAPKAAPATTLAARTRASTKATVATGEAPKSVPPRSAVATRTEVASAESDAVVDMLARAGIVKKNPARPPVDIEHQLAALMTTGSGIEAATGAASRAAVLTGAHDPRATDAVLDAARRLLALGKLQSASDVLLDFIGHGFTDREAQRLLIEVDCALGRRDVAKEKCTLLSQAYRLDGRTDVAEDVDRLAQML